MVRCVFKYWHAFNSNIFIFRHKVHPNVSGVSNACYLKHTSEAEARLAYQQAWVDQDIQAVPA
jgi:hypothetical protein